MTRVPLAVLVSCLAVLATAAYGDVGPIVDGRSREEIAADAKRRTPEARKAMLASDFAFEREIIMNEDALLAEERERRARRDKLIGAGAAIVLLGAAAARELGRRSRR